MKKTGIDPGPVPRGPKLRVLIAATALAAILLIIGISIGPAVQSWLEPRDAPGEPAGEGDGTWYISQMHPWIIQPEPGQCPICGMDLTPVDPDRFAGEITIDPVVVQNMGIRVETADLGPIEQHIRTVGTVVVDESRVHDVVQRFGGWIEKIHVGARFDRVQIGDPLFAVYSPEVFIAERDFLVVREGGSRSADDERLNQAARRKLELFGIPPEEIERLEETGVATDTITVRSPADGVVWQKQVNSGSEIAARTVAYQIADLSVVWVEATIYEQQLPFVRVGQEARITVDYGAPLEIRGTVSTIYPAMDPRTRETRARLVFENPGGALRPEMFATVHIIERLPEEFVRVPVEAVVGTGTRNLVFVSLGRGRFEPRDVRTGPRGFDGRTAILEGIADGERVVVSGQFLLDSESKMREALAKVMRGELATDPVPAARAAPGTLVPIDEPTKVALRDALGVYLEFQRALYQGDSDSAGALVEPARSTFTRFIATGKEADPHFHHRVAAIAELESAVQNIGGVDLAALRVSFGDLSVALREVVLAVGAPANPDGSWIGMRCGMAKGIRDDGVWLQIGDDPRNPYFGDASGMRSCAAETWGIPAVDTSAGEDLDPTSMSDPEIGEIEHASHTIGSPISAPWTELSEAALLSYVAVTSGLYSDDLASAQLSAIGFRSALTEAGGAWMPVAEFAHAITESADLGTARQALGEIGVALRDAALDGRLPAAGWTIHRCGMARGIAEKGIWLQKEDDEPLNPFFGVDHGMSHCAMQAWSVTESGLEEVER